MGWFLELLAGVLGESLSGANFGLIGLIATVQAFYLLWLLAGDPGTLSWLLAPVVFVIPWLLFWLFHGRVRRWLDSDDSR